MLTGAIVNRGVAVPDEKTALCELSRKLASAVMCDLGPSGEVERFYDTCITELGVSFPGDVVDRLVTALVEQMRLQIWRS